MKVIEVTENKKQYLNLLLLLADEQEKISGLFIIKAGSLQINVFD